MALLDAMRSSNVNFCVRLFKSTGVFRNGFEKAESSSSMFCLSWLERATQFGENERSLTFLITAGPETVWLLVYFTWVDSGYSFQEMKK